MPIVDTPFSPSKAPKPVIDKNLLRVNKQHIQREIRVLNELWKINQLVENILYTTLLRRLPLG
ncbi:MAG: hypothetical protein V3V92_02980, partial [Candidatus Hydrothermarchaeales archaeon]